MAKIKLATRVLRVPRNILMPIILLFCIVGSFAINNSVFGVIVILAFGLIAFVLEEKTATRRCSSRVRSPCGWRSALS